MAPSTPPLRLGHLCEGKALSASTKAALAGHRCPEHLLDAAPCCTLTLGQRCCAVSKVFCPSSAPLSSARSAWHRNREGKASWTPQPREAIWGKTGVPSRSRAGKGLGRLWGQPKGRWVRSPPQTPWPQQAGRATPPTPPTQVPQRRACSCPGAATWEGFGTPELLGLDLPHVLVETCLCKLSSVLSELRARLGCWQSWAGECPSKSVTSAAAGGARGGRSVAGRATSRSSGLSGGPRLPSASCSSAGGGILNPLPQEPMNPSSTGAAEHALLATLGPHGGEAPTWVCSAELAPQVAHGWPDFPPAKQPGEPGPEAAVSGGKRRAGL